MAVTKYNRKRYQIEIINIQVSKRSKQEKETRKHLRKKKIKFQNHLFSIIS